MEFDDLERRTSANRKVLSDCLERRKRQVRRWDETFDAFGQLYHDALLHNAEDFPFSEYTRLEAISIAFPGIFRHLFMAKGNAALFRIEREDDNIEWIAAFD